MSGVSTTEPTVNVPSQGGVSVGSSSTKILDANSGRQQLWLSNTSDESITLGIGKDAVLNQGIVIPAGGGIVIDSFISVLQINAISASGSKNLAYCEVTN